MGVTNSNKTIDTSRIKCGGTFKVTLALTAAPDIESNPTDIVLILDRSGSMAGSPLANLKVGAKKFIDILDTATDGGQDGNIGSGSHIGIVSFASSAAQDTQLITSVATLKDAVDDLSAGGNTNHADAFQQALELFDPASTNAKVMVMFTDGETTTGPNPSPIAAQARAQGIVIYCIGLVGSDGLNADMLNDWATDPDMSHVALTPNDADLEKLFSDLAQNVSKTGATNIVIDEKLNPDFRITSILPPAKGIASMVSATALRWSIDKLGVSGSEGANLEFYVQHVGQTSGARPVNDSILYVDAEGNQATFAAPTIDVDCNTVIVTEECPCPKDVTVNGCQDVVEYHAGDVELESLGRILQVDLRLKRICPGRRVALAVYLSEVDCHGHEYDRGLKILTVPAHGSRTCRDVLVRCIKFVLPEDLDVSGGTPCEICNPRNFRVRVIANYIDTDYFCCEVL